MTHLSITLILQCSAQNCKSCNAKLQNLFQSPISQTVKNAWVRDAWGHGFKSYFTIFSVTIVTTLNFGNKSILLPKLSWTKIKCVLILIQKSAIITAFLHLTIGVTHALLTLTFRKTLYSAGWGKKKNAGNQVIFSVLR